MNHYNHLQPFWYLIALQIRVHVINLSIHANDCMTKEFICLPQAMFLWEKYFSSMDRIAITILDIINDRIFPHVAKSYEVQWLQLHQFHYTLIISCYIFSLYSNSFTHIIFYGFTCIDVCVILRYGTIILWMLWSLLSSSIVFSDCHYLLQIFHKVLQLSFWLTIVLTCCIKLCKALLEPQVWLRCGAKQLIVCVFWLFSFLTS